jgi:hypothetical protein
VVRPGPEALLTPYLFQIHNIAKIVAEEFLPRNQKLLEARKQNT